MMNFGLPTLNWQCSPDMRSFSPYHVNEFYQSSGFTRKRRNNMDVKCYRCGQIGHFRKHCNSATKKQKSMKNIARDKSRLQDFIRMKTCSNFPFHQLDDSEFRKAVSKFHFGLRLQIIELIEENGDIIIRENKGISNWKAKLSTVKEQLKNANDQQDKIKSEFEIFIRVSDEKCNELVEEKFNLDISQINSERMIQNLTDQLQDQKSIIRSLEEQTKSKLEELENERSICRELCEKMDYKISLNKEIREWRKRCYEQSDRIQHYKSLELDSGSNHHSQSELNTTQRGHNHRQRGRRNPRIIGSTYRRGTIIPR